MLIGPFGVCTSMPIRRRPPTLRSMSATGMLAPFGPYHAANCSGSVHSAQTASTGASKIRSITSAPSGPAWSLISVNGSAMTNLIAESS